ncbi:MAG: major capsid protein P2 [Vibrio sp.]
MAIHARIKKMTSMSGITFDGIASLIIPTGLTYESLIIQTNLSAEQLKEVKLTLNDEAIYTPKGIDLITLQKHKGEPVVAGTFVVPFSDTSLREQGGITNSALVTERNDSILLEISIGAAAESQTVPQIDIYAVVSDAQATRIFLPRMTYQSMQAGAIGHNDFDNLVNAPYRFIRRMFLKSDAVTELEILRDYVEEFKAPKEINDYLLRQNNCIPIEGMYVFNPIQRGFLAGYGFPTAHVNELKFRVTCSKSVPNIPILIESCEVVRPDIFTKK